MLGRDQGPHHGPGLVPGTDHDAGDPFRNGVDQPIRHPSHGDDHRDRHASLAGRPVGRRNRRVRRRVHLGIRQDDHVVLGAARAPGPAFHATSRSRRHDRATGVLPTKDTADTSGWPSSASTASRSPCTTLSTPSGKPARCTSSASSRDADGSFSEGLSTKQFPHATAFAIIHRGTMTGKLNGVMPATTPSGSKTVRMSMPVETSEFDHPLRRFGMPQANSTFSMPRATSPRASSKHLAVLPCHRRRQLVAGAVEELPQPKHEAGPPASATTQPTRHQHRWPTRTAASTSAADANATSDVWTPSAGS